MDYKNKIPVLFLPKEVYILHRDVGIASISILFSPDSNGIKKCLYDGFVHLQLLDNLDVINEPIQSLTSDSFEVVTTLNIDPAELNTAFSSDNVEEGCIEPSRRPDLYEENSSIDYNELNIHEKEFTCFSKLNDYIFADSCSLADICGSGDYDQSFVRSIENKQSNDCVEKIFEDDKLGCELTDEQHPAGTCESGDHVPRNIEDKDEQNLNLLNYYEDELGCEVTDEQYFEVDELGSEVFLSQLQDNYESQNQNQERNKTEYVGFKGENDALKQLISSEVQSGSKQQKTIMFDGPDIDNGQTIQKIDVCDSMLECRSSKEDCAEENQETAGVASVSNQKKKYQCGKCNQLFRTTSAFSRHIVKHGKTTARKAKESAEIDFNCEQCGKRLKSREKFEAHCLGHGNPDVECSLCYKVFASKFTLRAHQKIHERKYHCTYCTRTFDKIKALKTHLTKSHHSFFCKTCKFVSISYDEFKSHRHSTRESDSTDTGFSETLSTTDFVIHDSNMRTDLEQEQYDVNQADDIIKTILADKMFLSDTKRQRQLNKTCIVCDKAFDRMSDLKRHHIEHLVKEIRTKTCIKNGVPTDTCPLCPLTFDKLDKFKAHLRSHAKLTLYHCNFCDKSFSDSSNFSKHKKVHDNKCLKCDLCQRKFNSKKMLEHHMDYHKKHSPLHCAHCPKVFYFESMLNKHVKGFHTKELRNRFRCQLCSIYFKCLKDKWDHEWKEHKVRKSVIDCPYCDAEFRKYSELKRHCTDEHFIDIPPSKKFMKKKKRWY